MPDLKNPAERLEHQLHAIQNEGAKNDDSVRVAACTAWNIDFDDPRGTAEFSRRIASLAKLAAETRERAHEIKPMGPAALEHFDQVERWIQQVTMHNGRKCSQINPIIENTGWYSLSLLATLLVDPPRLDIDDDAIADMVQRCRELVDQLAAADDLPARERQRLIDLVREVEDALLHAQVNGIRDVENALDGLLGGLVRVYVASTEAINHPAVRGAGALIGYVIAAMSIGADYTALEGPIGDLIGRELPGPGR